MNKRPSRKSLDSPFIVTSTELTKYLGCNGARLKELEADGLPRAATTGPQGGARYDLCHVRAWELERAEKVVLASEAATRLESLDRERAKLTHAQTAKVEMANAVARRELAPIAQLGEPIRRFAKALADHCAALPMRIKNRAPELSSTVLGQIRGEIAAWQNECLEIPERVLPGEKWEPPA